MPELKRESRPRCQRCLRPESYCVCAYVTEVVHRTRVLILQHPDEHKHPLNTGRLAVLGLQRAQLLVGEHFPQLPAILSASAPVFLLFPGENPLIPQPLSHEVGESALLIVPDGTWRKARKILRANPILNSLPRLRLEAGVPSRYRIRKTREPAAVSTIEAIARCLTTLEPDTDFRPLLEPFEALIDQQITAMGANVYQRHYGIRE